ncbi:altered inheritance of mitochondria protein 18, mitochondrial [Scheffersomyces xylosifermentans]|uniref:altered inheritance of mitochondria protein 18, mitochondrial n=1 Tax=Scheffersomyces xylosifermentans TaxID=1304137 RepID=UPI00315CD662
MFSRIGYRASIFASRVSVRSFSRSTQSVFRAQKSVTRNAIIGFGGLTVASLAFYGQKNSLSEPINLDSKVDEILPADSITVDSSIDPFPTVLKATKDNSLHTDFQLLGHGVRTVTFVSFKVYGIGIYVAQKDVKKAKNLLKEQVKATDEELNVLLNDPVQSTEIVQKLLDQDVKLLARICPVRNTDFNHMKDGLIKSILAHSRSKEKREELNPGLEQLRETFQGRKGSVPKNHLLYLEILAGGKLAVAYENPVKKLVVEMGVVEEPLVSNILFLSYLSGSKPLSEPLRKSCVAGLESL